MNTHLLQPAEYEREEEHTYHPGSEVVTRIVGVTFNNRQAVIARLTFGEEILLRREPNNPYDPNAIRVERQNGEQFGYINRCLAANIASFFDARTRPVSGSVHCLTGSSRSGYSLGVIITFTIPQPEPISQGA